MALSRSQLRDERSYACTTLYIRSRVNLSRLNQALGCIIQSEKVVLRPRVIVHISATNSAFKLVIAQHTIC